MGDSTGIEWTQAAWNPTTGCTKVSEGYRHCCAEPRALRMQRMHSEQYRNGFELTVHPETPTQPLRWTRPGLIFLDSMSDIF